MNNLTTTIPTVLKYVSQFASFPLRWFYTEQKLDEFIKLDISASGGGIEYYFPSQEGSCWLKAYNLSPFDFTFDRMQVDVSIDGASFICTSTMPILIKGMSEKQIYVRSKSPMTPDAARSAKESKQGRVDVYLYVIMGNCNSGGVSANWTCSIRA